MRKLFLGFILLAFVVGLTTAGSVYAVPFGLGLGKNKNKKVEVDIAVSSTTTAGVATSSKSVVDLVCMQTAITKRDDAVIAALDKYHASWRNVLEIRRDSLVAAWQLTDRTERWNALRKAWTEFYKQRLAARRIFRQERDTVWKTFRAERNNCGKQAYALDFTNHYGDNEL